MSRGACPPARVPDPVLSPPHPARRTMSSRVRTEAGDPGVAEAHQGEVRAMRMDTGTRPEEVSGLEQGTVTSQATWSCVRLSQP